MKLFSKCVLVLAVLVLASGVYAENIWDLHAVNADGTGSHAKVGADYNNPDNKVTIQGIALNAPDEILEVSGSSGMYQIYVQAESPDQGGMAVFSGNWWWGAAWCPYPLDIEAGDRIQVVGFIEDHNGKVNLNDRHSPDPKLTFQVTTLQEDAGMPTPIVIPSVADCNYFDETRSGGGEFYQCRWAKLNNLHIESGEWGAGEEIIASDISGATITILLSAKGDFDLFNAPLVSFSVTGIFDQEDEDSPFHDHYRIWIKNQEDVELSSGITEKAWNYYQ